MVDVIEEYGIYGEVPHLPQEFITHIQAEAGRVIGNNEIENLPDQERAERAGAIITTVAKKHFEAHPESEYIDFLQHPEFKKIIDLLVMGEDKNIGWRFEWLGRYINKQGMGLVRPSYQYFTKSYENSCPDYFGVFKYQRNSPEYDSIGFSSPEKSNAVQANRDLFQNQLAA